MLAYQLTILILSGTAFCLECTEDCIYPRLWGVGPPGSLVAVQIVRDSETLYQKSNIPVQDDGTWSVTMHTGAMVGTGFTVLVINNESGSMIRLNDVAFGEVWVCSGQSNMEWTIIGVRHALQVKCTLLGKLHNFKPDDFHRRLTMQLTLTKMFV